MGDIGLCIEGLFTTKECLDFMRLRTASILHGVNLAKGLNLHKSEFSCVTYKHRSLYFCRISLLKSVVDETSRASIPSLCANVIGYDMKVILELRIWGFSI